MQPVLMMSPMVRTRTTRSWTCSPGLGGTRSFTGSHWPLAADALAAVAEVDARHFELLFADVFPHVHLGPVAEREDAHVLAGVQAGVVEVPDLRALVLRVPLAEAVAEAEEALLGAGLLLVAPRAADAAVEAELLDGRQQRGNLQAVAADLAGRRHGDAVGDGVLDRADDELGAEFRGPAVAELVQLREMMAGVDVEQRHRDVGGAEGLFRQAQQADGVLAAGEEQRRAARIRRRLRA